LLADRNVYHTGEPGLDFQVFVVMSNRKWKFGYWIGSRTYIPAKVRYFLENYWFKYMVYNFPTSVINKELIRVEWRNVEFNLKIRKNQKYARDPYPFTQDPLGELNGPLPGYLRYYKPNKGDIIIDAGSYPGVFAIWLSKKIGDNGKVYCFEPDLACAQWCRDNLKVNDINNVEVITKGLGDRTADNMIKLDDFVKEKRIPQINFIKWDIEGAEVAAMNGSRKTFTDYSPLVAIASYHIVQGRQSYLKIEPALRKLGYHVDTNYTRHLTTYASKDNKTQRKID